MPTTVRAREALAAEAAPVPSFATAFRTLGGIVAGGLFVLPSLFILVALSWVYVAYGNVPVVAGSWLPA